MILLHGTTRKRAERIVRLGPLGGFREPGEPKPVDYFCLSVPGKPNPLGTPERYARNKANLFPDEGGAVILELDIPDEVIAIASDAAQPLEWGVIQFDRGPMWDTLAVAWPSIPKTIRSLA